MDLFVVLIEQLEKCPQAKALFEEAQATLREMGFAALEVHLESTNLRFKAKTKGNVITINPNLLASEQRYLAIFELTNVIQLKEHAQVLQDTANGVHKCSEDYVRAAEFVEYKGKIRANAVARAINQEKSGFFRPYVKDPWHYTPLDKMGFDVYYKKHISTAHKEHHRENFRAFVEKFNLNVAEDSPVQTSNGYLINVLKIVSVAIGVMAVVMNVKNLLNELMRQQSEV